MPHALILLVALALETAPSALSPEAAEHNTKAMAFYDARQLGPAFDEFYAAYTAMPDPRRDRAGREILLGSMHAALLELHEASGEPAPLCRLQEVLQVHVDTLTAAFPESPDMIEIRSARERHKKISAQLIARGPDACAAPVTSTAPPSTSVDPPAPQPSAPETTAPPSNPPAPAKDVIPPRQLRIAGGVTLGLGVALLGVMAYGIAGEASHEARVDEIDASAAGRPLSTAENQDLLDHRGRAQGARSLAIGTGVAAGVATVLGATLFVLAQRSARMQRLSATPWWSTTGAGLTLRVQLGSAR